VANALNGSIPKGGKRNTRRQHGNERPEPEDDRDDEQGGRQGLQPRIGENAAVEHQYR